MRLHPFIWQNYRETSAGQKAIDFYSRFGELLANESSKELIKFVNAQYYEPVDPERIDIWCSWADSEVFPWARERTVRSLEEAERLYADLVVGGGIDVALDDGSTQHVPLSSDELLHEDDIHIVSFGLFKAHPEFFFPYVFFCHFFRLAQLFRLSRRKLHKHT